MHLFRNESVTCLTLCYLSKSTQSASISMSTNREICLTTFLCKYYDGWVSQLTLISNIRLNTSTPSIQTLCEKHTQSTFSCAKMQNINISTLPMQVLWEAKDQTTQYSNNIILPCDKVLLILWWCYRRLLFRHKGLQKRMPVKKHRSSS